MKNISLKLAGVTMAFAFAVAAVPASAITQDQIDGILGLLEGFGVSAATIADIEASLTGNPVAGGGSTPVAGGSSAACGPYTAHQTMGSTGPEVVTLQTFLEEQGYLTIPTGVSKGYFGSLTEGAVKAFQTANGVTPVLGYFGNATMDAVKAYCGTTPSTPGTPSAPAAGMGPGEASITNYELNDEEDEVAEGDSETVAVIEVEVEDGDLMIERIDLTFDSAAGNTEDEPWDAFEEITLVVDGDEVASEDVTDEDDWKVDTDPYEFRFQGLEVLVMDGDTVEIEVVVMTNSSVDDAGTAAQWTLSIEPNDLRGTDGEGIDSYEGSSSETVTFDIVSEGEGDDLDLESSKDSPDADTIVLSEDDTEEALIFAFELDAGDSDNDIDIDQIDIDIVISSTTGAIEDVVRDFYIKLGGAEVSADSYTDDASSTTVTFDVDKDVTVDADEDVTVELWAEFEDMASDSDYQGVTITASLDTTDVSAEGRDDVTVGGTNQDGEAQTLQSVGLVATYTGEDFTAEAPADDLDGTIVLEFELSVVGDDQIIAEDGSDFEYAITGATEVDALLEVDGEDADSGDFTLDEGTYSATFSVKFATTTGFVSLDVTQATTTEGTYVFTDVETKSY